MFIKYERVKSRSGERLTYLCAVESYWDNGVAKQRRIKSYGCLERQHDPAAFIRQIEAELPILEAQFSEKIELSFFEADNSFEADFNTTYNYGYKYLDAIYSALNLDKYFESVQCEIGNRVEYRIKDIFKFLVLRGVHAYLLTRTGWFCGLHLQRLHFNG